MTHLGSSVVPEAEKGLSSDGSESQSVALVTDENGVVLSWSAGAERLFRCSAAEILGRPLSEWIALPADFRFAASDSDPTCRTLTTLGHGGDGGVFPLELTANCLVVAAQRVCVLALRSPSSPLTVDSNGKSDENRYRLLFEFSPQPMWVYDVETLRFLTVNQTAVLKYGYSRDEFLAMTIADLHSPEDRSARIENVSDAPHPAGDASIRRHLRKDGSLLWAEFSSHPILYAGRPARLIVATDITARVEAERALRESEERLRTVVNNAPIVLFALDADGVYTLTEGRALEIIGRKPGEAVGHSIFERYAGQPEVVDEARRVLSGEPVHAVRWYGSAAYDLNYTPILDDQGKVVSVIGVGTDITAQVSIESELRHTHEELEARVQERTADLEVVNDYLYYEVAEREQAEEALRESEARFRTIAEATPVAVTITRDSDGTYVFVNAHFRRIVGLVPDASIIGHVSTEFYADPQDRERLRQALDVQGIVRNHEVCLRRADETRFWISGTFQRMMLGNEQVIFSAYDDITDRKRSEEALRLAEESLLRSNMELRQAYDATIEGWSRALDLRDHETEGHCRRVTDVTLHLARSLGVKTEDLIQIRRGALLHDIGKMGVPDGVLLKPGALTEDEWLVMRRHPQYAYEMLAPIEFLRPALDIPWCHHERWDGTGYPRGLSGAAIPLAARLFAVVDVWDALRSDRPYRKAWPEERVREHIQSLAGTHFDPEVVPIFLQVVSHEDMLSDLDLVSSMDLFVRNADLHELPLAA